MSQATELIARQMAAGSANARVWADILYNVKLYGAKGDWNGTTGTDDTAAIQATIDAAIAAGGKAVFFPHGTYKVTALTNLSSVVLFGDNASFVGISTTINQIGSPTSNLAINVKDFGTKGDGLVNDAAAIQGAITAATTNGGIIYFQPGTYKISTALTVPSNVTLWFANGAKLSVDTGIIVTINGPINAGLYQIFSGLGLIRGSLNVPEVYPEWWGAKRDNINDDAPTIQKAIDAVFAAGYEKVVKFTSGKYVIYSTITLKHGTTDHMIKLEGYGAELIAGTSGMTMMKITGFGANPNNIGLTKIRGLKFNGNVCTAAIGLLIGRATVSDYASIGVLPSSIVDCIFEEMLTGVTLSDGSLFQFDRCTFRTFSVGSAYGVQIKSIYDGTCTDHWFTNCQFDMPSGGYGVLMTATTLTTGSKIGGTHFTDCVFYGQAIKATANANSSFQDIFLNNCAVDGKDRTSQILFSFQGNLTTGVKSSGVILMSNVWSNSGLVSVYADTLFGLSMGNCKLSGTNNQAIDLEGTDQCSIANTKLYDVNLTNNGGGAIKLGGTGNKNKVLGCNVFNASGHSSAICYIDSTQIKPIVTNNTTDAGTFVTNNVAGVAGTDFIVSGNL